VIDDGGDDDVLEIEHRGDVNSGNSGSQFLGWWETGPFAVGTHAGGQTEKHCPWGEETVSAAAGGKALIDLVTTKKHW
jgi:hypothetical protein